MPVDGLALLIYSLLVADVGDGFGIELVGLCVKVINYDSDDLGQ